MCNVASSGLARTVLIIVMATGCSGLVEGWSVPEATDEETDVDADVPATTARALFDRDVLPLLSSACAGCHANGDPAIAWMKPMPDEYATVKAWPRLVSLEAPAASLLLTKGMHQGPAWSPEQAAPILAWLEKERDENPVEQVIETNAVDVVDGPNTLMLDAIGPAGTTLTFTAQKLTYGLYLSNITLTGGATGVNIKHPLFVTWQDTTPSPDPVDSFDTVELDLAKDASSRIGGGLLMLSNVPANAKLSISFKHIGPAVGSGTTTLPGCKVVSSFTQNARTQLSTNCVSCHGGANAGATAAVDMTKINDTSAAGQATACGQILGRVNLTTPDQSGIFLAPDPASGVGHPFKLTAANFTTFKTAINNWITAEKAAP